MYRGSAGSMFGGAGGRGAKISVSSLEGLRNALRPDNQQQPQYNAPVASIPGDDKKTMEGLNSRLSGYLERVRQLEKYNHDLEEEIDEILKKKGQTPIRDWEEIEKPLADLRKQIQDMTMDSAHLLLQIDNNGLANADLKNKLEAEQIARQSLEHEVSDLRKVIDDTQLSRLDLEGQLESTKEELAYLKKDHRDDVAELKEKIRTSNVTVETDSAQSNLSDMIGKIRVQYEKIAENNREETDEWYKTKFENINVEVSKNTESLQVSTNELTELQRQKQLLDIEVKALFNMIASLENTLKTSQCRYGEEVNELNHVLKKLEGELRQLQENMRRLGEEHKALLNVKMELEAEINSYRELLSNMEQSLDFTLEQALQNPGPEEKKKDSSKAAP